MMVLKKKEGEEGLEKKQGNTIQGNTKTIRIKFVRICINIDDSLCKVNNKIEKGEKIQGKKNRKGGEIQGECPSKNLEGKKISRIQHVLERGEKKRERIIDEGDDDSLQL